VTALSGYEYDVSQGRLGFTPRFRVEDFRTFWSLDSGWGSYAQRVSDDGAEIELSVAYGELALRELYLGSVASVRSAIILTDGTSISATFAAEAQGWTVLFGEELLLKPGQALHVSIQ
jgi:hypothetical protein